MSPLDWAPVIAATGSALASLVAAWRANAAHDTGERNTKAIQEVAKAVNGGLTQKLEPIVKRAAVQAITETAVAREQQPDDDAPHDTFTA